MENRFKLIIGLTIVFLSIVKFFLAPELRITEPLEIASNLLETGEFKYWMNNGFNYNYQFPIYPILVASSLFLFNHLNLVLVLNILLSAITAWYFFRIINHLFSNRILSVIGVLALLFHPGIFIYQVGSIHPFALDLLFALMLSHAWITRKEIKLKQVLLFAGILGIALLNRPTLVVFAVPMVVRLFAENKFKIFLGFGIMCLALAAIPSSIWLARNYSLYNQISLNSSYGQNLWIGIQEETEGTAQLPDGSSYYSLLSQTDLKKLDTLNPIQESDFFQEKYRNELEESPGLWTKMFLKKSKNFWWFRDELGVDYGPKAKSLIPYYKVFYVALFILSILGMISRNKKIYWLWVAMILLGFFQASFYVETRHRVLIEPFLIISALAFVHWLLNRKRINEVSI